ncbi:PREDICTED: cathepsin L1-like, partial [Rhagoletis zephyria]|uniref:cathepsin L1-like n=1 Tax=Rhagoletis zephyria TaxID=28612 RepID=UPI000811419D
KKLKLRSSGSEDGGQEKEVNQSSSEEQEQKEEEGKKPNQDPRCTKEALPDDQPLPSSFSWKEKGFVSPVYEQGECGACFVFSSTSALESQYMISRQTQTPPHYSVQATLNCITGGCGGGAPAEVDAYYVKKGAMDEERAPYVGKVETCRSGDEYPVALKADAFCSHGELSEEQMMRLLVRLGPASVAISTNEAFYLLKGEPWNGECDISINHAVLLVGYDEKHFILKNSWGNSWGIDGYLYLPRGGENENKCGIKAIFSQPIVNPV